MSDLYDQDFIGWTEQQARLLRDAAALRPNLGLDWDHLIEEVEDLGRSHHDAVSSQIARIIEHLLKLEFSSATDPRPGWRHTVRSARAEIERRLDRDPGLKSRLTEILLQETPRATCLAAGAMDDHGEDTGAVLARLHSGEGYTLDHVLGDWLPGDARG